jgi:transcriptional regulator with XRE-family HTH domain
MEDSDYSKLLLKIASNIKKIRTSRKLTQEEMADFGFNYRFFQKLEGGKYSFNLYTLYRVAKALKVSIQDLLR